MKPYGVELRVGDTVAVSVTGSRVPERGMVTSVKTRITTVVLDSGKEIRFGTESWREWGSSSSFSGASFRLSQWDQQAYEKQVLSEAKRTRREALLRRFKSFNPAGITDNEELEQLVSLMEAHMAAARARREGGDEPE